MTFPFLGWRIHLAVRGPEGPPRLFGVTWGEAGTGGTLTPAGRGRSQLSLPSSSRATFSFKEPKRGLKLRQGDKGLLGSGLLYLAAQSPGCSRGYSVTSLLSCGCPLFLFSHGGCGHSVVLFPVTSVLPPVPWSSVRWPPEA